MALKGILKQSTAADILLGPFVDDADGNTAETGLTISAADVRLSKNGQNMVSKNDATACVHDEVGMYNCELDATDTNTVGVLTVTVHESGALHVVHEYQVVEEAVYDAMYGASAAGPLQSTTAGRTLDVTATGAAGIDWGNIENASTAVDLSGTDIQLCDTVTTNTDAVTVAAIRSEIDSNSTQLSAIVADTGELQTDWADGGRLDAILDARASQASVDTVDGNVDLALADTAELQADWANGGRLDLLLDQVVADTNELQADWADGGRLDLILDARASQASVDTVDGNVDLILADTGELQTDWADGGRLDVLLDGAASAGDPWTTSLPGAYGAGTAGYIVGQNLDAAITDRTLAAADYFDPAADTVANVTTTANLTNLPSISAGWITAAGIAASALDGKGDWNTTTPPTAAAIRGEVDSNSTQLALIVADTAELQTDWADGGRLDAILDARASQSSVDTVDGNVDLILEDTATTIPATLTTIAGYIDTEVADIKTTVDKLDSAVEADGSGGWQFTTLALENGPSGGGGGGDATEAKQDTIIATLASGVTVDTVTESAVDDIFVTHTIAEGYTTAAADGTPGALLYELLQTIVEQSIDGTTLTVKKRDGSTTATEHELTLSGSQPIARTRSS